MGATRALTRFALATDRRSPHARQVRTAVEDTIACALAATGSPVVVQVLAQLDEEATTGRATVWCDGRAVGPAAAAYANATAGHALDWDDVSPTMPMHPSTVLVPALVAVAEQDGLSRDRLVDAYAVGAAAFRGVARLLPHDRHYGAGWHTTSTVGRLAAVVALARLVQLTPEQTEAALGLVTSTAAGTLANFGSTTKPLHAGFAARDAVTAVRLAGRGATAGSDLLEARSGFWALYDGGAPPSEARTAAELEYWFAHWPEDWAIKQHAGCYATHRAADAALELRARMPSASAADAITVTVAPGQLRPLLDRDPVTADESRFSMAHVIATVLVHGDAGLSRFTPEAFADPAVRTLAARVSVNEHAAPDGTSAYAEVAVHVGGATETARVLDAVGSPRSPLSEEQVASKVVEGLRAAGRSADEAAALRKELDVEKTGTLRLDQPLGGRSRWPTVRIVDETMREGMQIEDADIDVKDKIRLLDALSETGLRHLVVGSFVSPRWVPQMRDIETLIEGFTPRPGVEYTALALNQKGIERRAAHVPPLSDFDGVGRTMLHLCDVFLQRNTGRTLAEERAGLAARIDAQVAQGCTTAMVGVNAAWGSNWVGPFTEDERTAVLHEQREAWEARGVPVTGVYLGDPMSWNTPGAMAAQISRVRRELPGVDTVHLHLHDARGSAMTSAYAALRELDERHTLVIDAALGGLGGCPYCGNGRATRMIPTEDLVSLLEGEGIATGIDLSRLIEAAHLAEKIVGHDLYGRVSKAGPRPDRDSLYPMDMPLVETMAEAQHFRLGPGVYAHGLRPWKRPITSYQRDAVEEPEEEGMT